jgi:transcriptional regulator with XRE-family HTH domain
MVESQPIALGPILRALRNAAGLSQRELAAKARIPPATLARLESGATPDPRLRTVERLIAAAGGEFLVVHAANGDAVSERPGDDLTDEGDRHYPAHLELRPVRSPKDWPGAWWAYWYDLRPEHYPVRVPDYTFDLRPPTRPRRRRGSRP